MLTHNVHRPDHYVAGRFECREVEKALSDKIVTKKIALSPQASRLWFAAFEYLWRWAFKNKVEDLEKCRDNIDQLILEMKSQENMAQMRGRYPKVTWSHDEDGNVVREVHEVDGGCASPELLTPADDIDWGEKSREY